MPMALTLSEAEGLIRGQERRSHSGTDLRKKERTKNEANKMCKSEGDVRHGSSPSHEFLLQRDEDLWRKRLGKQICQLVLGINLQHLKLFFAEMRPKPMDLDIVVFETGGVLAWDQVCWPIRARVPHSCKRSRR